MNKSVLEVLEQALTGSSEIHAPRMPVTSFDRVLGQLRSPIVPKLLGVVWHFGIDASKMNKSPTIGLGVDAVLGLISSELINEYGTLVSPDEQITVRWHLTEGWVVVAVQRKVLHGFMASPSVN